MSTLLTGDPTTDAIVSWITNGGKLQSTGAILGLGMVVKAVMVPIISRICVNFKINFSGPNKLHGVIACGFGLVAVINITTQQHLSLGDTFLMGVQAGIAAIGIHAAGGTLADASKAQAEKS